MFLHLFETGNFEKPAISLLSDHFRNNFRMSDHPGLEQ